MIETLCQECNGPIQLPLLRSGRLPRFCGADCRKRAAARRESNRRATLTAAGICPRCKGTGTVKPHAC